MIYGFGLMLGLGYWGKDTERWNGMEEGCQ